MSCAHGLITDSPSVFAAGGPAGALPLAIIPLGVVVHCVARSSLRRAARWRRHRRRHSPVVTYPCNNPWFSLVFGPLG